MTLYLIQNSLKATSRSQALVFGFRSLLSSSAPITRKNPDLVGSPDVISNIRPVIYDDVWFQAISSFSNASGTSLPSISIPSSASNLVRPDKNTEHPYSLSEFNASTTGSHRTITEDEREAWDLQLRLQKQSLDAFNHAFWTDTNSRFNAYKSFVESSTKSSSDYIGAAPEMQEQMLEEATAVFYRIWLDNEKKRQKEYAMELYSRIFSLVWLTFRRKVQGVRWAMKAMMG
ncbi:hypothetical protein FRC02_009224 [Tulasnella sp. 418]|nr:hypothetical protein FRC02_009224 [Tulasnella sp. 418]